MPDSVGKRQRRDVKTKKAVAREQRRVARNQRQADRAAGVVDGQANEGSPLGAEVQDGVVDAQPERLEHGREGETELDENL